MADTNQLPTEVQVLEKALAQIRRGYTDKHYFEKPGNASPSTPGPGVTRTCAVGGVEQAIWRLTNADVTGKRDEIKVIRSEKITEKEPVLKLYAKVMKRLNRVAHRRTDPENGRRYDTVEHVTFQEPKKAVVAVFAEALAEARADAEKKRERAVA